MDGVFILVKGSSNTILFCLAPAMVDDGSLHDVVGCRAVLVVVKSQDAAGFDGNNTHPQLASGHRFKLRTEIYDRQQLHSNALVLSWHSLLRQSAAQTGNKHDSDDDTPSPRRGVIWSGGRYVGQDRPFVVANCSLGTTGAMAAE